MDGSVRRLVGVDSLEAATELLQRVRRADPTFGELEAADLQWWWRSPRPTDILPDLYWFDDNGPQAAVVSTDWGDSIGLDVLRLPNTSVERTSRLLRKALDHAETIGLGDGIDFIADRADRVFVGALAELGFDQQEPETVQAWMPAVGRPSVSSLSAGYRLTDRASTSSPAHHMVARSGPEVERRLNETSLYRSDLDLVILDDQDEVAAYGLFWLDSVTSTGLVEPMRTEYGHQGRGLARHVLTAGIDRLAGLGAERIKISYRSDNPAAAHLYQRVGFVPTKETVVITRSTDR